jgi:hypothetical protein
MKDVVSILQTALQDPKKKVRKLGMFDASRNLKSKLGNFQTSIRSVSKKSPLVPDSACFSARHLEKSFFESNKAKKQQSKRKWDEVISSDCTEMDDVAITGNDVNDILRTKRAKLPAADIFPGGTAGREETELKGARPLTLFFHILLTKEAPTNHKNSVPKADPDSTFTHSIVCFIDGKKYPGRSAAEVLSTERKVQIDYLFEFWKEGLTITEGEWLEKLNDREEDPAWELKRKAHKDKFGYVVPARMAENPGQGETDKSMAEIRNFTDQNWVGAPYGHQRSGYRCFDMTRDLMSWIWTNKRSIPPNRGHSH